MKRSTVGWALLTPALLFLMIFILAPIADAFWTSTFFDTPFAPKKFVGFQNYRDLFRDGVALSTLGFTSFFVIVSVALETSIGLGLALIIHQKFRGRGIVRAALLIPWAIPTVVAAILWRFMFNDQYGFVNLLIHGADVGSYQAWLAEVWPARWAIVVADVWKTSAFSALIILAGLQSIPESIFEAARVDGASTLKTFLHVTLPLLRPALLLAVLFRTMDAFRVFDLVYVMTQGAPGNSTQVLQYYGYQKMFPEQLFGYGSAISVVSFLILAILSFIFIRLFGTKVFEK